MNVAESVRVALRALGANKLRAGLTMLGVLIGVGAVIALLSIGRGVQATVNQRIAALGSNLLFITPGRQQQPGVRAASAATTLSLTAEDAQAILDSGRVPQVVAVAPEASTGSQVIAGNQNTFTRIAGVTPSFAQVRNFRVAEGTFITRDHMETRALVAVLGAQTKGSLFGRRNAIGETIRIGQVSLRVVGVLEAKGAQGQANQDEVVLVPLTTMQTRLNRVRAVRGGYPVTLISVQLTDDRIQTAQEAAARIGELLRERHRVSQDDFIVRSQRDLLATANQVAGFITIFLGSVAALSLLTGGIGIMNIMLVSVTERTREIGIRKAVGAKRWHILAQFLTEAAVVSVTGGIVGIVLGAGGSRLLNGIRFGGAGSEPIQTVVSLDAIVLAFAVSVLVGLVFGVYPAMKAAALHPIDALRSE
jgi:putative ABC transport system permease protein